MTTTMVFSQILFPPKISVSLCVYVFLIYYELFSVYFSWLMNGKWNNDAIVKLIADGKLWKIGNLHICIFHSLKPCTHMICLNNCSRHFSQFEIEDQEK